MAQNKNITSEIIETLAVLSENEKSGWRKELNLISWNGADPKYDIRDWSPNHEKCAKGLTFTAEEMQIITEAFTKKNSNTEEEPQEDTGEEELTQQESENTEDAENEAEEKDEEEYEEDEEDEFY